MFRLRATHSAQHDDKNRCFDSANASLWHDDKTVILSEVEGSKIEQGDSSTHFRSLNMTKKSTKDTTSHPE